MGVLKSNRILFLFVLFCTIVFCIQITIGCTFETNDDVMMLLLSSGAYSGEVYNHLIFSNIFYGYFLTFLYSLTTNLEWYTLTFISLNVISFTLMSYSLIDLKKKWNLGLFIFLLGVFFHISVYLQFSTTAAITTIAGWVMLLRGELKYYSLIGIMLVFMGSLIRFDSFLMSSIILSPIGLYCYRTNGKLKMKYFSILIILILITKAVNYYAYNSDSNWKNYMAFNRVRGNLQDNPSLAAENVMNSNEIDSIERKLFLSFFYDSNKLNLDKIKEKYKRPLADLNWKIYLRGWSELIRKYKKEMILLAILSIVSFLKNIRFNYRSYQLLMVVLFFICFSYVGTISSVKNRVFVIGVFSFIVGLSLIVGEWKNKFFSYSFSFLLVLLGILMNHNHYHNLKLLHKQRAHESKKVMIQTNLINEYLQDESKKLIDFSGSYNIEKKNPFEISSTFPTSRFLFSGWMSGLPVDHSFNSFKQLNENIGLFINEDFRSNIYLIERMFEHYYGYQVQAVRVKSKSNWAIYEFKTV